MLSPSILLLTYYLNNAPNPPPPRPGLFLYDWRGEGIRMSPIFCLSVCLSVYRTLFLSFPVLQLQYLIVQALQKKKEGRKTACSHRLSYGHETRVGGSTFIINKPFTPLRKGCATRIIFFHRGDKRVIISSLRGCGYLSAI